MQMNRKSPKRRYFALKRVGALRGHPPHRGGVAYFPFVETFHETSPQRENSHVGGNHPPTQTPKPFRHTLRYE